MGIRFPNCVGLAAGMDKDGEHVTAFGALGFGSVEDWYRNTERPTRKSRNQDASVLSRTMPFLTEWDLITSAPFRLQKNLQSARAFRNRGGILGVNIGKNKVTPNDLAIDDYMKCMDRLYMSGDYIAINISLRILPNLRDLQAEEELNKLLAAIAAKRKKLKAANKDHYVPYRCKTRTGSF